MNNALKKKYGVEKKFLSVNIVRAISAVYVC